MHVMSSNVFTFHVTFSLENDKRIPSAAPLLIANYSHPLNTPETFEFSTKIILRGAFVLFNDEYTSILEPHNIYILDER